MLDIAKISENASITDDLGADSLDIVDFNFQLGRLYGCVFPKINVLDHAQAVCGDLERFLHAGGLTEDGLGLMQNSLGAYRPGQLQVGMRPAEIFAAMTVSNWAQQCYNLFNYLPTSCPECGGKHAQLNARHQAICASCSVRLSPLEGDKASRHLVQRYVGLNMKAVV